MPVGVYLFVKLQATFKIINFFTPSVPYKLCIHPNGRSLKRQNCSVIGSIRWKSYSFCYNLVHMIDMTTIYV